MTPIVVASHMRSGTHLTIDLLRRNVAAISARYLNLDRLVPDHDEPWSFEVFEGELAAAGTPLLKTHTPQGGGLFADGSAEGLRAQELLSGARTLYVVRDGRDVMVSLFHYMRHYSERVRGQSFAEFLRDRDDFFQSCGEFEGLDRVSAWARHVDGWIREPRVSVVRYEDLVWRLEPTLRGALLALGLDAPVRIQGVPVPASLPRRALRRVIAPFFPRQASTAILPRLGVVGDAARYFSGDDEAFFRDRADEALVALEAHTEARAETRAVVAGSGANSAQ